MWKYLLFVIGIWHLGTAIYMWFAPQLWYVQTPGVAMMGLFNLHFIRDIALVFALSGAAMVLGVIRGNPTAVWFGAVGPHCTPFFISGYGPPGACLWIRLLW